MRRLKSPDRSTSHPSGGPAMIPLPDVLRPILIVQSPPKPAFRSASAEFAYLRAGLRVKELIWPRSSSHTFPMSSEPVTGSDRNCEFVQLHR